MKKQFRKCDLTSKQPTVLRGWGDGGGGKASWMKNVREQGLVTQFWVVVVVKFVKKDLRRAVSYSC